MQFDESFNVRQHYVYTHPKSFVNFLLPDLDKGRVGVGSKIYDSCKDCYMQMAVACYTAGGLQPNKSEADAKTPLLRIQGRDGDLERLTLAAAIFPAFALLLPERIGLKPQARAGEIKRRLFITPILFLPGRCRPACGQQSTVNRTASCKSH
jgi:hypothetical protein